MATLTLALGALSDPIETQLSERPEILAAKE